MASDLHEVFLDASGEVTGSCLPDTTPQRVTLQDALAFDLPFFPLYRRSLEVRWHEEIRFSEDVLFNLELLARNAGIVLDHGTIYDRIWGYDFGPDSKNLAVYVGYLRRKVEEAIASGDKDVVDACDENWLVSASRRSLSLPRWGRKFLSSVTRSPIPRPTK